MAAEIQLMRESPFLHFLFCASPAADADLSWSGLRKMYYTRKLQQLSDHIRLFCI